MTLSPKVAATLFIFLAAVSYGSLGVFAKFAYLDGVSPLSLAFWQGAFGLIFFVLLNIKKLISFVKISFRDLLYLSAGGFFAAATAIFYYDALSLLPVNTAIIMLFQFVWIGVAMESAANKKLPSVYHLVAILLCYAGTILSVGLDGVEGGRLEGLLVGFLSGVSFAFYIFISSTAAPALEALNRTFWVILSSFVTISVFVVLGAEGTHIGMPNLGWGAICGVIGVVIPFFIYAAYTPIVGAAVASLVASAELPAAILLSAVFLSEPIGIMQIIGSLLVLFAIFAVFLGEEKK